MRILHTGDLHLEHMAFGRPVGGALDSLVDVALDRGPDAVVIAGDLFDNRRPGPKAILHAVHAIRAITEGEIPVIIAPGNHDGMGTIADPDTHTLAWMQAIALPNVHVFTKPGVALINGIRFVGVPFPHKRAYDSIHPDLALRDRIARLSEDVTQTIRTLMEGLPQADAAPTVFTGHFSVVGAMNGSESTMQLGWDVMIDADRAFPGADYVALGHIHRQQQINARTWYAGSPEYLGFGEAEDPKGFLLATVEKGVPPSVEVISPGMPPAIVIETSGVPQFDTLSRIGGEFAALVRHTPAGHFGPSDAVALQRAVRAAGAYYVKLIVEEPEQQRRARVELEADTDVMSALRSWARAHEVEDVEGLEAVGRELMGSYAEEVVP